jgi:hypothetical protein
LAKTAAVDMDPHSSQNSKALEVQNRAVEGRVTIKVWRLKMQPWRGYRPVVADSRHLDEEQDPEFGSELK